MVQTLFAPFLSLLFIGSYREVLLLLFTGTNKNGHGFIKTRGRCSSSIKESFKS